MKNNLVVLSLINSNDNWREILSSAPYNLRIKDDDIYTILSYDQLESDFSNDIVQECRGLIVRKDDTGKYISVCVPYFKFFNWGESNAAKLDWSSIKVVEKIDGSLIKIWYDNKQWHISTNNLIDAFKADIISMGTKIGTFGSLVKSVLDRDYKDFKFDERKTYMFELCSPYNKVVVPHKDIKLYWLGTRDNATLIEELFNPNWKFVPKTYSMKSLDECIEVASSLPYDEEGYVVVDKDFNRIKVKSPSYVIVSHMRESFTLSKAIELVRNNEVEEFLTYFPEFADQIKFVQEKYKELKDGLNEDIIKVNEVVKNLSNRKEQAIYIQSNCNCPAFCYKLLDNKVKDVNEFLATQSLSFLKSALHI